MLGRLGGGTSVWLPVRRGAPAYASRHTVSFPFSMPCNWAHATAGSRDANDMLVRKLGSNLSLALTGRRAAAVLHLTPSWAPASHPTVRSCVPPHRGIPHPTLLQDPASYPTVGSHIPPHHGIPHPTPPWGPARDQRSPEPTLPHPASPGTDIPTSLPRIWSSVSCTSMRGRTVVKSFHQGQPFTPLFFLMFFCTHRMAKSWICTGHGISTGYGVSTGCRRQGKAGRMGAQHPCRPPGTLPFVSI